MIADNRDEVVKHDDLLRASNTFGRAVIDAADFAAEYGTLRGVANFIPGSITSMP